MEVGRPKKLVTESVAETLEELLDDPQFQITDKDRAVKMIKLFHMCKITGNDEYASCIKRAIVAEAKLLLLYKACGQE